MPVCAGPVRGWNHTAQAAMQAIALNDDYDFRTPVLDEAMRERIREQAAFESEKRR